MKSFVVAAGLLFCAAAFGADKPAEPKPGEGCPEHPAPAHPQCVKGDDAKDTFDKLDVEAKVITHDKVTITIKASKGVFCREVSSDKGDEYFCCVRPEPKPGDKPADDDSDILL